ncbi:NMDA receptor-regulated protein 1 [Eremomyces bilateralis CBS 781.70]|uniref:NMDA receptor-regulated protein 1 n=1 Tax=Eremomyces bilateralis CBS 781.70 TaxID=1392243 RepID=A0A6G1GG70_9PEZI|nr:NMDA receptor-regulated protein 1 [Eremomyces bilateralis CBS 781.70]KAF1816992.1 NMDA receptor-regulated protein 1 [Eremomyces bilateralis CBS 781.70]
MPQPLSHKENTLFRSVVKFYEAKQYKKGIKASDQILKKNPNHGDTQAMRALIMNAQGNTDEAFALAKTALRNDMKSHICWHVYGILYRAVKNLEEAIKAYKAALRLDPESAQIQRDLAFLLVQVRDYPGYIQLRRQMLQARPSARQNWTGLAVALHLSGDLAAAEDILNTYEGTLKRAPPKTDLEHSEALLYKNTIIAEQGDIERALEHLEKIFKHNLDRTGVMELKAKYLLELGRLDEAKKAYEELLERNNDYRDYYFGLEKSLGLDRSDPGSLDGLKQMYKTYAESGERVDAPQRIPLDFLQGDEFREAAEAYVRRWLARGIPSTFANIKALYGDETKRQAFQDIVHKFTSEIESGTQSSVDADAKAKGRLRSAMLYFIAQHYDYRLTRDLRKAMDFIDKAIEQDPEFVNLTMTKARIYKHYGDIAKAAETMNSARELDERDRYINTKCAKYQLRNDENENALTTMSKFTRNETVGGPLGDLHDMQCMWYITEDGESYLRQGHLSLALKRFKAISDIFDVWEEDQFDFHGFSLRKGLIRSYIDLIHWEDRLRDHPFYASAAISAIAIYITIADNPHLAQANGVPKDLDTMDAGERKKALKKAKKEQEKLEAERVDREKKAAAKKAGTGGDGEAKKEDTDPLGLKLVQTPEPLEEAQKLLTPLLLLTPKSMDAQNIGFEVFIRKRKYLLAMKALVAAHKLDPEHATLHEQLIRMRRTLDDLPAPLSAPTAAVMKEVSTILPASDSLASFNDAFLAKHKDSVTHVQSALRVRALLDPTSKMQNEKALVATLELPSITMKDAQGALSILSEWKSDAVVRQGYAEAASKKWPESTVFSPK